MSDELLKRADYLIAHTHPLREVDVMTVMRGLVGRVRELEAAYAALGKENAYVNARAERAEAELEQWTKWGIVEIAVRNPSVSEYIRHWEGRAERAEAERDEALKRIEDLEWENKGIAEWREFGMQALGKVKELRALLQEALQTIHGLVDQQAMDDPWWTECANRINTALGEQT